MNPCNDVNLASRPTDNERDDLDWVSYLDYFNEHDIGRSGDFVATGVVNFSRMLANP